MYVGEPCRVLSSPLEFRCLDVTLPLLYPAACLLSCHIMFISIFVLAQPVCDPSAVKCSLISPFLHRFVFFARAFVFVFVFSCFFPHEFHYIYLCLSLYLPRFAIFRILSVLRLISHLCAH
ncbi:unnamed protein product [Sphacelaria rigidula]